MIQLYSNMPNFKDNSQLQRILDHFGKGKISKVRDIVETTEASYMKVETNQAVFVIVEFKEEIFTIKTRYAEDISKIKTLFGQAQVLTRIYSYANESMTGFTPFVHQNDKYYAVFHLIPY